MEVEEGGSREVGERIALGRERGSWDWGREQRGRAGLRRRNPRRDGHARRGWEGTIDAWKGRQVQSSWETLAQTLG